MRNLFRQVWHFVWRQDAPRRRTVTVWRWFSHGKTIEGRVDWDQLDAVNAARDTERLEK